MQVAAKAFEPLAEQQPGDSDNPASEDTSDGQLAVAAAAAAAGGVNAIGIGTQHEVAGAAALADEQEQHEEQDDDDEEVVVVEPKREVLVLDGADDGADAEVDGVVAVAVEAEAGVAAEPGTGALLQVQQPQEQQEDEQPHNEDKATTAAPAASVEPPSASVPTATEAAAAEAPIAAAAADDDGTTDTQQPPSPRASSPRVKLEAMSEAERRYWALRDAAFDAAELKALRDHYLEPYIVETVTEGALSTRAGTLRQSTRRRRCRPRAQQQHARLWEGLQLLAERADAGAIGGGGGGASGSASASAAGADGAAEAARELLWWLRCLGLYDRVCHEEAPPRLLRTGRPANVGGDDDNGGGTTTGDAGDAGDDVVEVLDLVSESDDDEAASVDVDAFLLDNGWAIVRTKAGDAAMISSVRVKREKLADEDGEGGSSGDA